MGKRGRPCGVCVHKNRELIELGLLLGRPLRVLAQRFGFKSWDALHTHKHRHMSPSQRAALLAGRPADELDLEQLKRTESEGLLAGFVLQRGRVMTVMEQAMAEGDVRGYLAAERVIQGNYELVAKLVGELNVQHHHQHSVTLAPDYAKFRRILDILRNEYPEAALAVSKALHELESEAAADITARAKEGRQLVLDATPLDKVEEASC